MTTYHAFHRATARLTERFPVLAPIAGVGAHAGLWLARSARHAQVVGQQQDIDLMLRLDPPMAGGVQHLYLPVTPQGHDIWTIRTVLTEAQAVASLSTFASTNREARQQEWRTRKGFARAHRRTRRSALVSLAAAV
jgi:hypothetical protein